MNDQRTNAALWLTQVILAVTFLYSGVTKAVLPTTRLRGSARRAVEGFAPLKIRSIGIAEIMGGIGLILPWHLHVLPLPTPIAAFSLGIVMLLAAWLYMRRREYKTVAANALLLGLCLFVAIGRL